MKISIVCALLIVCSVNIIKISSIVFLFSAAYAANVSDHHDHVEFEENSINPFDEKKRALIFYH